MESFGQSMWDGYMSNGAGSEEPDGVVLGIDFGSSNSCVAVWRADKNKVKIIRNASPAAAKITPSLIQFNKAFKGYKIGNDCDASLDHVISNLKALILHPETEISASQDGHATAHSPWVDGTTLECFDQPTVLPNSPESSSAKLTTKTIPVEELVGFILSYLKDCAEDYLTRRPIKKTNVIDGSAVETTTHFTTPATTHATTTGTSTGSSNTTTASGSPALRAEVHRVVLGVPVNCTERSKQCLKSAAQLAGFTEVHFLVESTAAATAYGLTVAGKKNVLVFDMGGGTTDLSVLHIDDGRLTVQATGGNNTLGGKNIDALLLELVETKAQSLSEEEKEVFRGLSRTHLLQLCRTCKEELSTADSSTITIPYTPCTTTTTTTTTTTNISSNTTNATTTTAAISITVTLQEFEVSVKTVTDLVQATVYHTVKEWLNTQSSSVNSASGSGSVSGRAESEIVCGSGGKHSATSGSASVTPSPATINSAEDEEADGFVRVSPVVLIGDSSGAGATITVPVHTDTTPVHTPATTTSTTALNATTTPHTSTTHTIDEVVLVGGSSHVPCVRHALRLALGNLGINPFLDGTKELCTSLHPEEVVAEGLAIRGAVLSGVSGGKLRELLVMDCVNNAIGVMTWEGSDDSGKSTTIGASSGKSSTSTRIFNSILHKGMSIPASNTMRFPLEHADQKFVSLDIYEEVEECRLKPTSSDTLGGKNPTLSEREGGIKPTSGGSGGKRPLSSDSMGGKNPDISDKSSGDVYEMVYKYHVVATADVPIPAMGSGDTTGSGSGSVDIAFTMTTDGMLKFDVKRVQTSAANTTADTDVNSAGANMLIVYIVLMFVLYLFVKIVLGEVEVSDVGSAVSGAASSVAGGVVDAVSSVGDCVSDGVSGVCDAVSEVKFEL